MAVRSKTPREPSVVQRVSDILNLFTEARPRIDLKDAEEALGLSQPTAYRYLREMHEAGLLSRVASGYMPGPKVIELEFIIARYDPLLVAAKSPLRSLAKRSACEVLLGRLYDLRLVNVASIRSGEDPELPFPPGRTVPLFRGSQGRAVLAAMDRRARRRAFDLGEGDPARDFIGHDWKSFNATLQKNRRDGFYISRGELDKDVTGIAASVMDADDSVMGSVVAVFRGPAPPIMSETALVQAVVEAAEATSRLVRLATTEAEGQASFERLPSVRKRSGQSG